MNPLTKPLLIGILAAGAMLTALLWHWPSPSMSRPAVNAADAPAPFAPPAPASDSRAVSFEGASSQAPLSAETMALIHSTLSKWLDAKRAGSEEKEAEAIQKLEALLTDQNAAGIIRSLSAEEFQTPFCLAAIRHWTSGDPVQASNWLAARPDATEDDAWAAAQGWAAHGNELQGYLTQLPDTAWKQALIQEAGAQMSATDPAGAIELARQMDPGNGRTSLLQSTAGNWIATDPRAAIAWINSVSDPALREQLIASAAASYALTDPAQAAAWVASSAPSDGVMKGAALNIAQTWVTQDPAAAANWVSQFPNGETRNSAVAIVSKYWQQVNPGAATAWMQKLSAGN